MGLPRITTDTAGGADRRPSTTGTRLLAGYRLVVAAAAAALLCWTSRLDLGRTPGAEATAGRQEDVT